jgi:hypothetical protein
VLLLNTILLIYLDAVTDAFIEIAPPPTGEEQLENSVFVIYKEEELLETNIAPPKTIHLQIKYNKTEKNENHNHWTNKV